MNPDSIIAGLKAELAELEHDKPEDFADRKKQIEARISEVDGQPRPLVNPEDSEAGTVYDRARAYLEGLARELEESASSRQAEIKKEIKRVEDEIAARSQKADKSERAERATSRATNTPKVERAVSAPADE